MKPRKPERKISVIIGQDIEDVIRQMAKPSQRSFSGQIRFMLEYYIAAQQAEVQSRGLKRAA